MSAAPTGRRKGGTRREPAAPPPLKPPGRFEQASVWLAPALVAAVLYARTLSFPLVYWDDTQYIFDDARLSPIQPWRILTEAYFSNYHPLTTFTYALDRLLWDRWLPGFHLTHLAFYCGGVAIVGLLFARLLGARAGAVAACLYAAHAIHVEPVAWLAQRKDVVCLVLYAGTLLAWARYRKEDVRRWYFVALGLGAAAMLAKGYAVVLPALLLAYDACFAPRSLALAIRQQLPLVGCAAAVGLLTVTAQGTTLAEAGAAVGGWQRVVLLLQVFAIYAGKALLPVRLSVIYPVAADWQPRIVAVLGLLAIAALVWGFQRLRRSRPAAAFGLALYLLPLVTVMNVLWTLPTWMNDRYLFLPTLGSTLTLVAVGREMPWRKTVAWAAFALYAGLTVARTSAWQSEVALWSTTARDELGLPGHGELRAEELPRQLPQSRALVRLARAYVRRGDRDAASALLGRIGSAGAAGLSFSDIETLAASAVIGGRYAEAIALVTEAARQNPSRAERAELIIGAAEEKRGDPAAARAAYERAAALAHPPSDSATAAQLGIAGLAFAAGDFAEAARRYELAQSASLGDDPRPSFYLGLTRERLGDPAGAQRLYDVALALEGRVSPNIVFDFADVLKEKGLAAEALGRPKEALELLGAALAKSVAHPERANIHLKMGQLAERVGDPARAVREYRTALDIAPQHPDRAAVEARIAQIEKSPRR